MALVKTAKSGLTRPITEQLAQFPAQALVFTSRGNLMLRTACRANALTAILVAVFVFAVFAPVHAWAADDDAPEKASRLIAVSDFNRDGIADIAEATLPGGGYSGQGLLTVSLGQADGTFKRMASSPVLGHAPRSIVAGDFNGDGIADLIVGDDNGTLMLFLGDGTGNLVPAGDIAHLDSVVSIAVADFNHDGIPDVAVSDWRASTVTVLFGIGKGAFRRMSSFPLRMPGTVPHVVTADFNHDGIPDLAVVYGDDDGNTFEVMLGNGNGAFTFSPALSFVKDPNAHCNT